MRNINESLVIKMSIKWNKEEGQHPKQMAFWNWNIRNEASNPFFFGHNKWLREMGNVG